MLLLLYCEALSYCGQSYHNLRSVVFAAYSIDRRAKSASEGQESLIISRSPTLALRRCDIYVRYCLMHQLGYQTDSFVAEATK